MKALLMAVAGAAVAAGAAGGQSLAGVVVDGESGDRVPGVFVVALDSTGAGAAAVDSDAAGRFRLTLPVPGAYTVTTHRLGYAPLRVGPLRVADAVTMELELRLAPSPVGLAPLRAVSPPRDRRLAREGFYLRQHMGIGRFVTRDAIEREGPHVITDVLRMEPSVRVVCPPAAGGCHPMFRRAIGMSATAACAPLIVLDGMRLSRPPLLDHLVHPNDVEAIEVYPGAHGAPALFKNPCGVLMIWTRRG